MSDNSSDEYESASNYSDSSDEDQKEKKTDFLKLEYN